MSSSGVRARGRGCAARANAAGTSRSGHRSGRQPAPAGEHPTIKKGDNNEAVAELQEALGVLIADGDFGEITDNWVRGFQAACGLANDGVVGR